MNRRIDSSRKAAIGGLLVASALLEGCAVEPLDEALAMCEAEAACDSSTDVDSCAAGVERR